MENNTLNHFYLTTCLSYMYLNFGLTMFHWSLSVSCLRTYVCGDLKLHLCNASGYSGGLQINFMKHIFQLDHDSPISIKSNLSRQVRQGKGTNHINYSMFDGKTV